MNKRITTLLGGLNPAEFLAHHWHKSPLLVRQAMPDFLGLLTPKEIKRLATHPDVQSRLVQRQGKKWMLTHGPFRPIDFKTLPEKNWTLLIQEANHWLPEGEGLLEQFNFAPHARLDDLMVSYAVPGGGVGPHFDSYDVFLLQGFGVRRWEITETDDLELLPDSELKLLRRFEAQQGWDLKAGDMLYLPPQCAHHGVAQSECFTYSIGFRAPTYQEWVETFLDFLRDQLCVDGRYADPDLKLARHPGNISSAMVGQIDRMLRKQLRWDRQQVSECIGRSLSEPKPHVCFDRPATSLTSEGFVAQAQARGLRLDARSRVLISGKRAYFNGDSLPVKPAQRSAWVYLADYRQLPSARMAQDLAQHFYPFWQAGWMKFL